MESICYAVRVSTGCTCCSNENFIEGPYRAKEAAEASASSHNRGRTLRSQYAENGRQEILELPYEMAGDWIILDARYAVKAPFLDESEDFNFDNRLDMFDRDYRL